MLDARHLPGSAFDEEHLLIYRGHPIILLPLAFATIFLIALPPAVYLFLENFVPSVFERPFFFPLFVLGASAFFLAGWLFLFFLFLDYWLDVFVLTERRILDIEQSGLFGRTVSEFRLYRTQDVTAEIKGFWHSIFDYGDVYVQTAGEQERFHFASLPHPNLVAKQILEWAESDRKMQLEER